MNQERPRPTRSGWPLNPRVLLSSGDPSSERETLAALQSQSCEVLLAAGRRQTLGRIHAGDVDVLVLDFAVHSRKFSQFASEFRLGELPCRTLVLAHSLEQAILATEAQADGVLVKPLDPNHLRSMIRNLLLWRGSTAPAEREQRRTVSVFGGPPTLRHSRINE